MRFARGPLLALVWTALSISGGQAASSVRGVSPDDADLYSTTADTWKCLHSDQHIPAAAINDDYCDCKDGSDEPGTSACANSSFYCHNEGHIPAYLPSSRVNDGICDPACCDGTDEYGSGAECANVCGPIGRTYRKKKQESDNVRRAGSKIREKYIADRAKALEQLTAQVTRLEVDVEVAQERERRAREALQAAEKMDEQAVLRKKATPLYSTLKQHQDALQTLLDKQTTLTSELEKLTSLLDDLAKGYNPNYQDMAVKGAVMAYRSWRRGDSDKGDDDDEAAAAASAKPIDEEDPAKLNELLSEGAFSRDTLHELIEQDPLTLMADETSTTRHGGTATDEAGILYRIHEYLPDAIVPYFEAAVDTVLDLLLKANLITDVKRKTRRSSDAAAVETESVVAARAAHRKAEQALQQMQNDLSSKQSDLQLAPEKWGQRGEFKALDGTCVERNMGEYTYEFCFFGGATQKPNRGHGNVSLGRFSRFAPRNDSVTPADPAYYHRQIYDAGQRCWNGPDRSLIVDFTCATENALLDVFEGEKCIYEAKVTTPAVCLPLEGEVARSTQPKEEL